MSIPISVQLYTLREETEKDFLGTLEKVAQIGYKGVEFAGYGDIKSSKMKDKLDKFGLKASGSHVSMDILKNSLEESIEYNLEVGNKYIICPFAKGETRQDYLDLALFLNKTGEKCKKNGIDFGYHNHNHEFNTFDDKYALDIIFENTDSDFVKMELDTYWVQFAGIDPIVYMKKYSGRCPLVHQKDMEKGEGRGFTEVGEGIMDIKGIYNAALEVGAEWFIVEQDKCIRPSLESIKISFENLKKMGFV